MTNAFVYVASAGDQRQKVGISIDPAKRLADLSGACGYRLTLVSQREAVDALAVEKMAHWLLRQHQLHGEWFEVDAAKADDAVSRAVALVADGLSAPCRIVGTGARGPQASTGRRSMYRLSWRRVITLRDQGVYADGGGLYLRVDAAGSKRWTFIFQWNKRRREMGLGSIKAVSLAEAREAAEVARKQVRSGIDPIAARDAKGAQIAA